MHISVHSPWLPSYIDVAQTVHIILVMVGLFPDRPHIYSVFPLLFFYLVQKCATEEIKHLLILEMQLVAGRREIPVPALQSPAMVPMDQT